MTVLSSDSPQRVLILCGDIRFSRLLEAELAGLGLTALPCEAPPVRPEGEFSLAVADGDSFAPSVCVDLAEELGCPLLLFSRTPEDPPLPPGLGLSLKRPFLLSELEKAVRELTRPRTDGGSRMPPASLRHEHPAPDGGRLLLQAEEGQVTVAGRTVSLTPAEQAILSCLLSRRGETVPREELAPLLGGGGNSVDVYVCRLRAKLEKPLGRRMIHTVRGAGYRLEDGEGR